MELTGDQMRSLILLRSHIISVEPGQRILEIVNAYLLSAEIGREGVILGGEGDTPPSIDLLKLDDETIKKIWNCICSHENWLRGGLKHG